MLLKNACDLVNEKVNTALVNKDSYISTENMLPNKEGITEASSLPNTNKVNHFGISDILVSNIRPYFKKIWMADMDGGCSSDVLVFRSKSVADNTFLYYVLSDDNFFTYVTANSKGTKMPRGDKKSIMEYEIPNITYVNQKKIAKILSNIDCKIALNNKINKNLVS